jgi:hypothetical protein
MAPPPEITLEINSAAGHVVWMLRAAIRGAGGCEVHVRNDNRVGTPPRVALKAVCGPGDDSEPVIRDLLPDEGRRHRRPG